MPTININRKVLEKAIGKKLPTDKLKDRISMLGTDLESIEDDEIIVEIFPNRPDMLSEQGFGRALSSFLGVKTGLRKYDVKKSGEKVYVSKDMAKVRPYTVCCLVKNLKLDDEKIREIIQIQEKLHVTFCRRRKKAAIGIYPLEKIKLPIYFEARSPEKIVFRPLESNKEMNANDILKNHPTGIKYKELLKRLSKFAVFRDENNEILSLTPIINSHKTGKIVDTTKEAFMEVSGFDLHTSEYVLNILATALIDMGATIESMDVVYPDKTITTPNLNPWEMEFEIDYINNWLGLELKEKDVKELLERMGFGYKKVKGNFDKKNKEKEKGKSGKKDNGDKHIALIPCYRPDIIHPSDLCEDIAVSYGYENFKPEIPSKATTAKEDEFEKFRNKVANILVGLNMLETSSYHLSNPEIQFEKMNLGSISKNKEKDNEIVKGNKSRKYKDSSKGNDLVQESNAPSDYVKILHSVSEEYNIMRYSMLPNLMQILSENTHNEYPQNIFESGTVFKLGKTETGVVEFNRLACVLCNKDADYTKIRQVLDYLLKSLGFAAKKDYEVKESNHPSFIKGRVARVSIKGKNVAYVGEVNPKVLDNFEVSMPVSGFELNLSEVFGLF